MALSENYEKGAIYSKLAGDKTEKTGSLIDGISYAIKRITCMEQMPKTNRIEEKIVHLRTILGLYMIEMNFFKEAQEMLQKWENNDSEVRALWEKMNGWVYDGS